MIIPKKSLGGTSEIIPAQLLPGTKNPSIVVFLKKNSVCLWNPRTKTNLAILEEINKSSKIITTIRISRIWSSKEILISTGLSCGKILIWKLNLINISIKFSWYVGHFNSIKHIQISNRSSKILSGCSKGSMVLWDLTKNKGIFRKKVAHLGEIKGLEFLAYNKDKTSVIISYGTDNLLKIWDIRTGICIKIVEIGSETFLEIKIKKEKNLLLALTRYGNIIMFLITTPFNLKYLAKFQGKKSYNESTLLYDFNQSILVQNNGLGIINIFLSKKPKKEVLKKNLFQDFEYFYSKIISYNFKKNTSGLTLWKGKYKGSWTLLLHTMETHFLDFFSLSFKKKRNIKLEISIKRIYKRKIDNHSGEIRTVLWFLKDKFLITLCSSANSLFIWNISLQKCIKKFRVFSSYISMEYSDNNSIIMGSATGNIDLYEISSGTLIFSEKGAHNGPIWALDCAENSNFLGTGSSDGILKIWEREINQFILVKQLKVKEQILNLKLISSRNFIILSGISSVIWVFSLNSLEFKFSLQGHSLPIVSSCLCDNKRLLATSSADLSLRIWDIFEKNQKKVLFPEETVVTSIIFQPFSVNFLSASRRGNIICWDGNTFLQYRQYNGYHMGPIWTLKFSENGNYLASGSSDKTVIVWKRNNLKLSKKNLKEEKTNSLQNTSLKRNPINKSKLNNIIEKFKTLLQFVSQLKKKRGLRRLKSHIKKLFFEIEKTYSDTLIRCLKSCEIISLLNILTEKSKLFLDLNFFQNFPKILGVLKNLEKSLNYSDKQTSTLKIKKKIVSLLKLEKIEAIKILNKFKK